MRSSLACVLIGVALAGCGHGGSPQEKPEAGAPATDAASSSPTGTTGAGTSAKAGEPAPPPEEDPEEVKQRRAEAVAKNDSLATEREKLKDAFAGALVSLAMVRANGGTVAQARVNALWLRLKTKVCFTTPKLNLIDRTKNKSPAAITALRTGAQAKLDATRAHCGSVGTQPLNLTMRLDAIDGTETPGKEKVTRVKPGANVPADRKPTPDEVVEYELETLKRTVSANGEVSIDSRVFPFKVSESSRDKGNTQVTTPEVRIIGDPLEVRAMAELTNAVVTRILEVVQQALDRHLEGLRKAYTTMAISTAQMEAGAHQDHHLMEVLAVGGRIDADPTVAGQLAQRYGVPAADVAAAVAALHLE